MFVLYVNHPTKRARVHRAGCNSVRQHGGVSRRKPPTGYYVDDLQSPEAAEQIAREHHPAYDLARHDCF